MRKIFKILHFFGIKRPRLRLMSMRIINFQDMKKEAILRIIRLGESETVEFKENFDKETVETVSAFANTKGGMILG